MILLDRVAFSVLGYPIYWYGLIMAVAAFIAVIIASKKINMVKGLDEDKFYTLVVYAVICGMIGARLYYCVFYDFNYYFSNPINLLDVRGGGLAIHGAVIGGLIPILIFTRKHKISFLELTDIIAPSLILAQGIGRWGNFANGEAHGGPTNLPWGIMVDGVKVHPTFLYESIWDLLIFVFLHYYMQKKEHKAGTIMCFYLILYGIGRFFIEGLRTDSLMWGNIRVAQAISIFGILLGLGMLHLIKKDKLKF